MKIKNEFTHIARLYGFKCFFNIDTNEVQGTNWFNEKMIAFCLWMEQNLPINEGFEIQIIEKLQTNRT